MVFLRQNLLQNYEQATFLWLLLKNRKQYNQPKVADVYNLPFEDGLFDVIYMITVISEIPEPTRAMREFYRVLSPTGILAFSELLTDPDYPLARTLVRQAGRANFQLKKKMGNFFSYTLIFEKRQQNPGKVR